MSFFGGNSFIELDELYLLESDIETLKSLCITNKNINKTCMSHVFWVKKFNHDGLPVPKIKFTSINNYITTYINSMKIMDYIYHVLNTQSIRIDFDNLNIFYDYVDDDTAEKIYMQWQKLMTNYTFNVSAGDDFYLGGLLYIRRDNKGKYTIVFRIDGVLIENKNALLQQDIVDILYDLISTYHYPYDNVPITLIEYNF
jgi:hypothetical protein